MMGSLLSKILPSVFGLIEKAIPDKTQREALQAEITKMYLAGELAEQERRMSAILLEAQQSDPFVSRARPTFLYVMYAMILGALPIGFAHAFWPAAVAAGVDGVQIWLAAVPGELWTLFGAGYLGYVWKRSDDKKNVLSAMSNIAR